MKSDNPISTTERLNAFKVPHTYVIIFYIVLAVSALTYLIPAGSFDRAKDPVSGKTVILVESFHYVDPNPATFVDIMSSFV